MDNAQRKESIERLKYASPLETASILQELELYDSKSAQEVIDEVYEEFKNGGNVKEEVLKPVFTSVIDGLLESTAGGRAARKKGLTASRVIQECESFSYDAPPSNALMPDGYTEYKNINYHDTEYNIQMNEWNKLSKNEKKESSEPEYEGSTNSNMTQKYNRDNYADETAMNNYKKDHIHGEKTITDEYTEKDNLYSDKHNPHKNYNDPTHRKQGQTDHIIPLKTIHDQFKHNYALDDTDIKNIANQDYNFAMTSAGINQKKKDSSNTDYANDSSNNVDEQTAANMKRLEKEAQRAINDKANETVLNNLMGKGTVDKKVLDAEIKKYKDEHGGNAPTKEQRAEIEKNLQKKKANEIRATAAKDAAKQSADNAVGNVILFIVKPLYYEFSDIFKNGMQDGVGASSTGEALKIRFGRVKDHVVKNVAHFLGDNIVEFVKGFISSLIESIISLFVGMFKQVLKIIKEGIKIFVQSAKILFGAESANMSPAQKGDAIIKLLGGSIITIAGVGIEALINKIGIGEPWSIVLSTMLTGIASALFMYLLDKADIFSVKAEKRRDRILEIFEERRKDIQEAFDTTNFTVLETLKDQRLQFAGISGTINKGIASNNIEQINSGLYNMANFLQVDVPYSNTDEFSDKFDSGNLSF